MVKVNTLETKNIVTGIWKCENTIYCKLLNIVLDETLESLV